MSRVASIFFVVILLIASAISLYLLYENLPFGEEQRLVVKNPQDNISEENGKKAASNGSEELLSYSANERMQFYPDMRFSRLPILYLISNECTEEKVEQIQRAMEIISSETGILFVQSGYNIAFADSSGNYIDIMCSDIKDKEIRSKEYYVAGEGGPREIVNTSLFNVIIKGEILLLRESQCPDPIVSMHEILHALGFGHSSNQLSIMYNISDCRQKLTKDITDELKRLYSIESLPDLYFKDINATKAGRHLSFDVEIKNRGLISSENTTLSIYVADEKIESFDIDLIEIGAGIMLKVSNLRLPARNTNEIRFVIDAGNKIRELSEENNIAILSVE